MRDEGLDLVALSDSIFRYELAYNKTLREQLARYSSISEAFPYYLGLPRRIVAVHCRDGIVLARYPNEDDGFEFRPLAVESVSEVAEKLSEGMWEFDLPRHGSYFVELRNNTAGLITASGYSLPGSPPWQTIVLTNSLDITPWHPAIASADALNEVHSYVAAHLMNVKLPTGPSERSDFESSNFKQYESLISEFRSLLDSSPDEASIQTYLSRHPALLALDAARVLPQFRLGKDYVPDFVLELADQQYVLVEIEAASHQLYTQEKNPKKRKPTSALVYAQQQIENWRLWIDDIPDYARRLLPGISEPECWVIIGRRPKDRADQRALMHKSRRLKDARIMTYDDLLDRAERQLAALRRTGLASDQMRQAS